MHEQHEGSPLRSTQLSIGERDVAHGDELVPSRLVSSHDAVVFNEESKRCGRQKKKSWRTDSAFRMKRPF